MIIISDIVLHIKFTFLKYIGIYILIYFIIQKELQGAGKGWKAFYTNKASGRLCEVCVICLTAKGRFLFGTFFKEILN